MSSESSPPALLLEALHTGCRRIRPRTWLERRSATRSVYINLAVWAVLIVALTGLAVLLTVETGEGVPIVPALPEATGAGS